MIYVSPGFWNGLSGSKAGFDHFTLWIAHWDTNCPDVPSPWTSLKFWQYADNGSIPGVSGGVDHDLFNGSDDALKAFAGASPDPGLTQVNGNDGISAVNWARRQARRALRRSHPTATSTTSGPRAPATPGTRRRSSTEAASAASAR